MPVPKALLGATGTAHLAAKAAYRRSVAACPVTAPLGAPGRNPSGQRTHVRVQVQARRANDDNWVEFDGEEQWDDDGPSGRIGTALSGPILNQATRAVGMVVDRLTDVALQFAPEDASPGAVRAAVAGGLILVALSFVKGVLSFILTIGTVFFGAFIAVRVFGWDGAGSLDGDSSRGNGGGKGRGKKRVASGRQPDRPRGRSGSDDVASGVAGLLGSVLSAATSSSDSPDDGLIDVWFDGGKGKKKKAPAPKKKR